LIGMVICQAVRGCESRCPCTSGRHDATQRTDTPSHCRPGRSCPQSGPCRSTLGAESVRQLRRSRLRRTRGSSASSWCLSYRRTRQQGQSYFRRATQCAIAGHAAKNTAMATINSVVLSANIRCCSIICWQRTIGPWTPMPIKRPPHAGGCEGHEHDSPKNMIAGCRRAESATDSRPYSRA
jgi:hypothetical protein